MNIQNQLITADELFEHPEWDPCELLRGKVIPRAYSGARQGLVAGRVAGNLYEFVVPAGLGVVFASRTGFILERKPDTVCAPDVAFVSKARVSNGKLPQGYFPGPPDLAVESVPAGDQFEAFFERAMFYIRCGVRLVWMLDPQSESARIYGFQGKVTKVCRTGMLTGEEVLPGLSIVLTELFQK